MRALLILTTSLFAGAAVSAPLKLPLREGEYSFHACGTPAATEKDGSLGIYLRDGGSQFITPNSEGIDAYCTISKLRKAGDTFSGIANCERGGMRLKYPIGTYSFRYRVVSPTSFVTNDATYQWCAPHR